MSHFPLLIPTHPKPSLCTMVSFGCRGIKVTAFNHTRFANSSQIDRIARRWVRTCSLTEHKPYSHEGRLSCDLRKLNLDIAARWDTWTNNPGRSVTTVRNGDAFAVYPKVRWEHDYRGFIRPRETQPNTHTHTYTHTHTHMHPHPHTHTPINKHLWWKQTDCGEHARKGEISVSYE